MKKYIVEFTFLNGEVEQVEFNTDRLEWTLDQWSRHRPVAKYKLIEESTQDSNKRMLFG